LSDETEKVEEKKLDKKEETNKENTPLKDSKGSLKEDSAGYQKERSEQYQGPRRESPYMSRRKFIFKKKFCRFCKDTAIKIDYKSIDLLTKYTKGRGKILPRRFSGNCAKHQRLICKAIKRARAIALLPYVAS